MQSEGERETESPPMSFDQPREVHLDTYVVVCMNVMHVQVCAYVRGALFARTRTVT